MSTRHSKRNRIRINELSRTAQVTEAEVRRVLGGGDPVVLGQPPSLALQVGGGLRPPRFGILVEGGDT